MSANVSELLQQANAEYVAGNLAMARRTAQSVIDIDPNEAVAYTVMGAILNEQGKFEEAVTTLRTAIRLAPNNSENYYFLGRSLKGLGNRKEAIDNFRMAIQLDANNSGCYYYLGETLEDEEKLEEAIPIFRTALRLEPNLPTIYTRIGSLLLKSGMTSGNIEELEESLDYLRIAINRDPTDLLARASIQMANGELQNLNRRNQEKDDNISTNKANSSCFIATAAYSTSVHPDLDTFRSFRDEKLLPHPLGAKLVNLYYKISPSLASYIAQQPTLKKLLKHHLSRLANWIRTQKISSN